MGRDWTKASDDDLQDGAEDGEEGAAVELLGRENALLRAQLATVTAELAARRFAQRCHNCRGTGTVQWDETGSSPTPCPDCNIDRIKQVNDLTARAEAAERRVAEARALIAEEETQDHVYESEMGPDMERRPDDPGFDMCLHCGNEVDGDGCPAGGTCRGAKVRAFLAAAAPSLG